MCRPVSFVDDSFSLSSLSDSKVTAGPALCPSFSSTRRSGSFVPFTIVVACSTHQAMEKNSADRLDREFVDICEEMKFDWPEFLPVERIKAGITEIALGLIVFAALVVFCRSN